MSPSGPTTLLTEFTGTHTFPGAGIEAAVVSALKAARDIRPIDAGGEFGGETAPNLAKVSYLRYACTMSDGSDRTAKV